MSKRFSHLHMPFDLLARFSTHLACTDCPFTMYKNARMIRSQRWAHFLVHRMSGSQWCVVHSGSSFELGCRDGSILRMKDSSAVGNNHQTVALSCTWIPDA